ncbi:hypothetical protein A2962_05230 [Candidatus Woesebacteria bacterium RIFCSPLOWO2_01_FULL_39_61]|uniref:Uncharacterized protein n=1 Tax=Candidatus Woesebacteria bacterium RIFCSPHIGHO2_02_FULL_39_13 TaxID=1802505 RepID=A0A1F7Z0Z6_9BACT|nr:MAG: hypothetical protein A2692_05615 [Candidatus Woesebacteria bacterium RIFCSPHIGHO2_01_FULL_39_95]OGM33134.1 MAG: hypothetical protein A3D01_01650 [Candidatus Woesebacteria bacterium RIFCSPHIGHO2_02_FULL_39_13]OGM39112.1 MAG: hypothetical protein A3E13_01710 [Candidatus Woesebacteria bacterium RIFCSPHIGHO2_12_FULL_40_20]OGM66243.1 MAG: hypothetical protein A2962_05230 [Candidatus Woesebacteria bacterium RIFCSPLOWO2_01_FULL_39_61]
MGYILVAVGILIMLVASYNVYSLFVLKSKPVKLFNLPGISLDMSNLIGSEAPPSEVAKLKSEGKLTTELVGAEILNAPLNLVAHVFLVSFFLNLGFKVASLGVQFVRPIKVNLKEEKYDKGSQLDSATHT